jgi:hypothetical protein
VDDRWACALGPGQQMWILHMVDNKGVVGDERVSLVCFSDFGLPVAN